MVNKSLKRIEEIERLINYINDNRSFTNAELDAIIGKLNITGFPLECVDIDICREIESLVSEWCDIYDVDENAIWKSIVIEDLILKL